MEPSRVRCFLMKEHDALKYRLHALQELARQVLEGDLARMDQLVQCCELLAEDVKQQTDLEKALLEPALLEVDAWGPVRVDRLIEHHRRQQHDVSLLQQVCETADPEMIASRALALTEDLLADVGDEEFELLNRSVLRDDAVGENVETG